MVPTVQKTMKTLQSQCIDEMIDVPVVSVVQVPRACVVKKTVEGPQFQIVETTAEASQTQVIQGAQTSESLDIAPEHQPAQVETLEVEKIGALLPAESTVLVPVAVPKTLDSPRVQLIDKVVSIPVMAQRQVPSAPRVQKIVEMPKVQFSDGGWTCQSSHNVRCP